ncbi:MAG: glycogen/starch/alpha-glucan phosphorylase, partial [Gammaproteobacteria bacterium]
MEPLRKSSSLACLSTPPRLGMDAESLAMDFRKHFGITLARDKNCQSIHYAFTAIALTVRDRLMERWKDTNLACDQKRCRQAYYLSMEFLMGRAFGNAILNLGIEKEISSAVYEQSLMLEELAAVEHDAGLGNGGLGRLAACFVDSCATLQL